MSARIAELEADLAGILGTDVQLVAPPPSGGNTNNYFGDDDASVSQTLLQNHTCIRSFMLWSLIWLPLFYLQDVAIAALAISSAAFCMTVIAICLGMMALSNRSSHGGSTYSNGSNGARASCVKPMTISETKVGA